MDFYEAVAKRRTVRDFTGDPVPAEIVERILAAGLQAPSNDHFGRDRAERLGAAPRIPLGDETEQAAAVTNTPPCYAAPPDCLGHPAENAAILAQHAFRPGDKIHYNHWPSAMPEKGESAVTAAKIWTDFSDILQSYMETSH